MAVWTQPLQAQEQSYLDFWHDDLASKGKHDCAKSVEGPESPVNKTARPLGIAHVGVALDC